MSSGIWSEFCKNLGSNLEALWVSMASLVVTSAFAEVKLVYETSRTGRAPSGVVPNAFSGIDYERNYL